MSQYRALLPALETITLLMIRAEEVKPLVYTAEPRLRALLLLKVLLRSEGALPETAVQYTPPPISSGVVQDEIPYD